MYKNTLTNDFIASDKQTELKDFINSKNWYDFIIKIGFETVAKKIKIVLKEYICKTLWKKHDELRIIRISCHRLVI